MNEPRCDAVAELLVEYADGELTAADARRVADHLAGCADCRAELRLLRHSLDLAREVWHESAAAACAPEPGRRRPGRRHAQVVACLAAGAVAVLLVAGVWLFSQWQAGPVPHVSEITERPEQPRPAEEPDLAAVIAREGRSARLAAAARLLAAQPGLEQYSQEAQRYLAEAYRGTAAVNGIAPPNPSSPTKEPES